MATVLIVLASLTLLVLAGAGCDAIAHGRRPRGRDARPLRAEDAMLGGRDTKRSSDEATAAAEYDRKRSDLSGLAGF